MILAVDTETTGTDFWHGCKPFMITACDGSSNYIWEGEVNPYDRSEVTWNPKELSEAQDAINSADQLLFHNAKFDIRALESIGVDAKRWDIIEDTMVACHICCSGEPRGLKYLAYKYLDYDNVDQRELSVAVQRERFQHKDYDLAKVGHRCFPGITPKKRVKWYRMDYWLAMEECRKYACDDVEMTWYLWDMYERVMRRRGITHVYNNRKELLRILYKMEEVGYNIHTEGEHAIDKEINRLTALKELLRAQIQKECNIGVHLDLGSKEHIRFLLFEVLKIDPVFFSDKTEVPSVKKEAIEFYLDEESNPDYVSHPSLTHYQEYREADAEKSKLESYSRYQCDDGRVRSNLIITGTRETRQASWDPNTQNIKKSLRHIFGPPPGYTWLVYDLVNIEMRIWGYEVGNRELKDLFDRRLSFHNVIAEYLYPAEYKQCESDGITFKNRYKDTLYQWIKNGNFSIIYGAGREKADNTYKLRGAYDKLVGRFPEVPVYTQQVIDEVLHNEYTYGIPFLTCLGGYPLEVPLNELNTKACNYKSQGSAGYVINLSMIEVDRDPLYIETGAQMVNQVHDSLYIEVLTENVTPELKYSLQRSIEKGGELVLPTCEAELEDELVTALAV